MMAAFAGPVRPDFGADRPRRAGEPAPFGQWVERSATAVSG
jgi:hypothetical protein